MGTGDTVTLTLKGGAPWGFRLQGGGPHPLQVSKIRKRSPAHAQGMQEGDTVVSINGVSLKGRTHDEAMRYVDMSGDLLAIEVFRGNMPSVHTVAGSYAPVINGHSSVKQEGDRVTSTTSASYDDGVKKGSIQTESFVEKGNGRETRGFVHSEHMSSVVHDEWAPTQAPLPSLLDTSLSKQPYSSQPVQVQVSAMFSGPKDDTKIGNATPKGYSSQQPSANVPMFNVRKVTSSTTSNTTMTTRQEPWQPSDSFGGKEPVKFDKPEDPKYPTFPLPEVKSWKPTKAAPPPPPPKPVMKELGITRVRDIKTEMLSPRSYDDVEDEGSIISSKEESITSSKHHNRLPVFAPPVQISLHAGERDDLSGRPNDLDLVRTMSIESEISSPTSSLGNRKVFGDSAFYADPEKNFPTIQDQMKLCKIIAHSLTSAANKKARGAKMFAKRQRRSTKWIHDGRVVITNPLDDIPGYNPHYYDEEEDPTTLHFKIPSVKHRVTSPEAETKMSLTQEEFEKLRLESQRCEHQSVSPNQCFDIAQSLKNSKGKAGKLFEKRRQRVEKYVVDETNAQKSPVKPAGKLGGLTKPLKGPLSPWDAALQNPSGSVERAFEDLTEFERKQKLNQMLKLKPAAPPAPAPRPATPPLVMPPNLRQSNLKADPTQLLQGKDFNRKARGWTGFSEPSVSYTPPISGSSSPVPSYSQQQQQQQQQMARPPYRDYNSTPKAWRTSGEYEPQYQGYSSPYASDSSNIMSPSGYRNPGFGQPASDLPGTDL